MFGRSWPTCWRILKNFLLNFFLNFVGYFFTMSIKVFEKGQLSGFFLNRKIPVYPLLLVDRVLPNGQLPFFHS
jgi:hypothetical protein